MTDARKKKPPASRIKKAAPAKPAPEAFIGHESRTMMSDETFAEFEQRMQAEAAGDEAADDGATGAVPAHSPDDDDEATGVAPAGDDAALEGMTDDLLPDEVEDDAG